MSISLKAARVNAGLTIKEASKELGISHSTLIKWEKEPWKVNPEKQDVICKTYDIPIDFVDFTFKSFKY